ncbi:hypothetical protein DICPUDRAFT_41415, partial [Dictyostelium purpureum]
IGTISSIGNVRSISKSSNTIAVSALTAQTSSNSIQCGCGTSGGKLLVGDIFIYTGAFIGSFMVSFGSLINNIAGSSRGGCGCN